MQARQESHDGRVFAYVLLAWVPLALVFWFLGPPALARIWPQNTDFPLGARASLAASALTFVITVLAVINLVRGLANQPRLDLTVPSSLTAWLPRRVRTWGPGVAAILLGYVIGTTIFR